jgi:histidyl-tRNA synthetase
MTRGRRREHYQWNMDVWGIPGPEAEVELLAAAVSFFKKVGLTSSDIGIKVREEKKVLLQLYEA